MTNIIQGNNNIISGQARDIVNAASNSVQVGDFESLGRVLDSLGIPQSEADRLREAIDGDKGDTPGGQIGSRTSIWLSNMLVKAGNGGLKVGMDIAASALTEGIKNYLGL